jgi:hypothetical protein
MTRAPPEPVVPKGGHGWKPLPHPPERKIGQLKLYRGQLWMRHIVAGVFSSNSSGSSSGSPARLDAI